MNLPVIDTSRGIKRTDIEWTDFACGSPFVWKDRATGELVRNACVKVSSGCANCYAETIGQRFKVGRAYYAAEMATLDIHIDQGVIDSMLRFKPKKFAGARPRVFLGDMTDIFGEWVPFEMIDVVFAAMALRPDVDWQILTKRPERMREYLTRDYMPGYICDVAVTRFDKYLHKGEWKEHEGGVYRKLTPGPWPLPNVWLGTSVESQKAADVRIPHLLACPAAVRFLSCEPLLGPLVFDNGWSVQGHPWVENGKPAGYSEGIDWVIVGGESGPGARPCDVLWIESIIKQCSDANVPVFCKQLGSNVTASLADIGDDPTDHDNADRMRLRNRKGNDPSEWPEHLRVRQMPGGAA